MSGTNHRATVCDILSYVATGLNVIVRVVIALMIAIAFLHFPEPILEITMTM